MSVAVDKELLSFAAEVLKRHGSAVEANRDSLLALLPKNLAEKLQLPEEIKLGSEGDSLLYGHPLLDRLVELSTREVPVVFGKLQIQYLKKGGFDHLITRQFLFRHGKSRIINLAETRTTYMVLTCRYLALSDERKEGLVQVTIQENSGAMVSTFKERWADFQPEFYAQKNIPPHFPTNLEPIVKRALKETQKTAENQLQDFLDSIRRHLQRDVRNTREYYEAYRNEMKSTLKKSSLSYDQRQDRKMKIHGLPAEMARKIEDLKQKYQIQVKLTACAAIRFLVPVVQVLVELNHHKIRKKVRLVFNPVTHQLDPVVCEHCKATIYDVHLAVRGSELQMLCANCYES